MQKDKTTQKLEEDIIQKSKSSKEQYVIKQELDALWQELICEKKLGITDMKLTNDEEDKKIIKYIKANKTKETYAFSRDELSKGTGISIDHLPYTTIIKISGIRFILLNGKLFFTIPTMKERFLKFVKNK
jgi:seryl-tRNA synthetase